MRKRGEGDVGICYCRLRGYIFMYICPVDVSIAKTTLFLTQSLEQGSDGITHRTVFVAP